MSTTAGNSFTPKALETTLPKAVDLYRQTANWLVGLAAAALAWVSTFAAGIISQGGSGNWWLIITGVLLALAIAFGICLYIALTWFAYIYEELPKARIKAAAADSAQDPVLKKKLDSCVLHLEKKLQRAPKYYGSFYICTIVCFFLSLIALGGLVVVHFGNGRVGSEKGSIILLDGRGAADGSDQFSVLLLDTATGSVHKLEVDSTQGGTLWRATSAHTRALARTINSRP